MTTCKRCGYEWISRTPNPITCPKCKSYRYTQLKGSSGDVTSPGLRSPKSKEISK